MLANFRSPEFRIGFYQDVLMSFTSVTSRNVTGERIKEKPGEDGKKKKVRKDIISGRKVLK